MADSASITRAKRKKMSRRDKKVDRIGRVTIYRHGASYWLYYRERGKTVRTRLEGNLAIARPTASKVNAALEESRPSPLGFVRISVAELVDSYLESCRLVRNLSPSTLSRYTAARGRSFSLRSN